MNKIDWDYFRSSEKYQKLSDKMKETLAHIYLEGMSLSEESLNDMIALDKGEITHEEFIIKTLQEATKK